MIINRSVKIIALGPTSLTLDMWSNRRMVSFTGVTAYFIHGDSLKQEQAAATGPSTSDAMARQLQNILEKYSIKVKLGSVTIDNGQDVVMLCESSAACPIVFRCAAHSLNIAVKYGLTEIEDSLFKLRELVRKVTRSGNLKAKLRSLEIEFAECTNELARDVPTRWNATFDVISRALKSRRSLTALAESKNGINLQ